MAIFDQRKYSSLILVIISYLCRAYHLNPRFYSLSRPQPGKNLVLKDHSIGIDLGTTYSLLSIVKNGKPMILPVDGKRLLPSVVSFTNNKKILVGVEAVEYEKEDSMHTFSSVKRLIGRTLTQAKETNDDVIFKNKLVSINSNHTNSTVCGLHLKRSNEVLLPEEISCHVLKKLIGTASKHYNNEMITRAVITVPAYFTAAQREATERAGYLAGLKKIKLLKEPEAAAFAYGITQSKPQFILVFDLGGGTFDVSVLEVGDGLAEVISTSGDAHLGGDDFDQVIVQYILASIEQQLKSSSNSNSVTSRVISAIRGDSNIMAKIRTIAIDTKIQLTDANEVVIDLPNLFENYSFTVKLSRGKFETLSKDLLRRILRPLREAAIIGGINLPGDSGRFASSLDTDDGTIDSSDDGSGDDARIRQLESQQRSGKQLSKMKKKIRGNSGQELNRLRKEKGSGNLVMFPTGRSIDDVILVGGATRMPCIVNQVRTLTGIDPKRSINPDEAVCLGAGVLAGILDNVIPNMQVLSPMQAAVIRFMTENKDKLPQIMNNSTSTTNKIEVIDQKTLPPKKITLSKGNFIDDEVDEDEDYDFSEEEIAKMQKIDLTTLNTPQQIEPRQEDKSKLIEHSNSSIVRKSIFKRLRKP